MAFLEMSENTVFSITLRKIKYSHAIVAMWIYKDEVDGSVGRVMLSKPKKHSLDPRTPCEKAECAVQTITQEPRGRIRWIPGMPSRQSS